MVRLFIRARDFSAVWLSEADRSKLKEVLRIHFHEQIGPEIRRELLAKDAASLLHEQQKVLQDRAQDADMGCL